MVATSMAYYAILLMSVMFAGHLDDLQLDTATLSGSLEMLCGQGYDAWVYRTMGVHL